MGQIAGCAYGQAPGTVGLQQRPQPSTRRVDSMVISFGSFLEYLQKIAFIRATAKSLRINKIVGTRSMAVNTVYNLLGRDLPEYFDVHVPPRHLRERAAVAELDALVGELGQLLVRQLIEPNPGALIAWGGALEEDKWRCIQRMDKAFAACRHRNDQTLAELTRAAKAAATVQLVASLAFTLLGGAAAIGPMFGAKAILGLTLGASGTTFAATATTFSITMNLIKDWNKGGKAGMVAFEGGKTAVSEGATGKLTQASDKAYGSAQEQQKVMAKAQKKIDEVSQRLQRVFKKRAKAKPGQSKPAFRSTAKSLSKQVDKYNKAESMANAAAKKGKYLRYGGAAVVVFFSAWDCLGHIGTFRDQCKEIDGPNR